MTRARAQTKLNDTKSAAAAMCVHVVFADSICAQAQDRSAAPCVASEDGD